MAGGSGERFWPLSRRLRPKQLLKLTRPDANLLEETVRRVAPLIPAEDTLIVTSRELREPIRRGGAGVPDANVLAEPCKRNTTGCLIWAAAWLIAHHGPAAEDIVMAVLSADHRIPDEAPFRDTLEAAMEVAEREDGLGVIGVPPTRPETGFGYIEIAENAEPVACSKSGVPTWPVRQFREKPDHATAESFLSTGRFFWNSGMFIWKMSAFLRELKKTGPERHAALLRIADALRAGDETGAEAAFATLDDLSIDFALLEKAGRVFVTRAAFEWDDIGAWDSLDRTRNHDACGNVALGDPVLIDTRNSVVYNEPGAERMAVAVVGMENVAVIVSADGVLVMPKDRAQDAKKAVLALKERGATQL
jgi:mannose-1-phosphate guanylyltransferase